ncbi:hypothetical protein A2875_03310 [Candidatus Gottesmanbacteria bacterium RIFCSPHIGHO2_01_FULL_46_14]|uniref:DUF948 domain-containing protein n=2 Tax=Candidatus Gottesmaniibacteriota TaxID=1752720 RepID=A0A1F5ZRC4_9BACT|nr:MAG: hypothetical protein A2875_03310 [Candidatus Gottesmanbacteria bacterium RIFCSPHIGHO2_01_FULL_46_14]OGG28779.1 MAG: hypothetical protein A2971_05260 [Candidatus Gottesmanbacteria bacterium RIFCSPLOWO2_01_FULL_46_21]
MDPVQLTIIAISFIITILIVFLGVQVWYILKEMRASLQKVNKMLEDAGKVSGTVSQGVSSMAGMLEGIKTGLSLFSSLRRKDHDDE